ncbi:MAG TPA: hypothetical protein VEA41_13565, partial [Salinarimonas sp.]|nr:hypothetical protein [Salinarimonas sp.]
RAGERTVLGTSVRQEIARLDEARERVVERGNDESLHSSWVQTKDVAAEIDGRTTRHSDALTRHAETFLAGGSGLNDQALRASYPRNASGSLDGPNAAAAWVEGRAVQRDLSRNLDGARTLPETMARMPQEAFSGTGRFSRTDERYAENMPAAERAATEVDRQLDRLETGRRNDATTSEATSAARQANERAGRLARDNEAMQTIATRQETIRQADPGRTAAGVATRDAAIRVAGGPPAPQNGAWAAYLPVASGGPQPPQAQMTADHGALTRYAGDAQSFVRQRQTELREQKEQSGDPDGAIGREQEALSVASEQLAHARQSLATAGTEMRSAPIKAGELLFGASVNLGIAHERMRGSIDAVRSEPR